MTRTSRREALARLMRECLFHRKDPFFIFISVAASTLSSLGLVAKFYFTSVHSAIEVSRAMKALR